MRSIPSPGSRERIRAKRALSTAVLAVLSLTLWGCAVPRGPVAHFVVDMEGSNQAPAAVTLDASGSVDSSGAALIAYRWAFGDGSGGTGRTVSHTYVEDGTFEVVLEVVNAQGLTARTCSSIQIAPTASSDIVQVDNLSLGDIVLVSHPSLRETRVGEVEWIRANEVRVRLYVEGTDEDAWSLLSCPRETIVKLSEEKTAEMRTLPGDYYSRNKYGALGLANSLDGLVAFLTHFRFSRRLLSSDHDPNLGSYYGDDEFATHDVFEATHMAAALECALEDAGFSTCLVVGPMPTAGQEGLHAWVLVLLPGQVVAVEPTEASLQPNRHDALVITGEISLCPYYTHPENRVFPGIHAAIASYPIDIFNWWQYEEDAAP